MTYRERNNIASVISEIYTKLTDMTPREAVHRVLTSMGFTPSDRPDFNYQKETISTLYFVNVDPDRAYISLCEKQFICRFWLYRSPLPKRKRINFIESEIGQKRKNLFKNKLQVSLLGEAITLFILSY